MKTTDAGPLGQSSEYPAQYDASVLHPIARSLGRAELNITEPLPFVGDDIWNAYELSWLNPKGKPQVALMKMTVAAQSNCIVESKSLKLYLGSFNGSRFESMDAVAKVVERDVQRVVGGEVAVALFPLDQHDAFDIQPLAGFCIDDLDIEMSEYVVDSSLLATASNEVVTESLFSHLMRSCCPVTGQPDWASVWVNYTGPQICHASLLRYIVSFRNNQEFHEQCVERVYSDLMERCNPEALTVYARYTRRGGIDINPFRSSSPTVVEQLGLGNVRLVRQ